MRKIEKTIKYNTTPEKLFDAISSGEGISNWWTIASKLEQREGAKGEFIWKEYLETKGEGVQHLGFAVNDIEKATAAIEAKGVKVWRKGVYHDIKYSVFDKANAFGVRIELVYVAGDKEACFDGRCICVGADGLVLQIQLKKCWSW